jgi:hypothetical protein
MLADDRVIWAIIFGAVSATAFVLMLLREIGTTLQAIRQTQDVIIERLDRLISK